MNEWMNESLWGNTCYKAWHHGRSQTKTLETHPEAFAGVVIIHVELAFALVITSCVHTFLNFLLLLKKTTENI